GKAKGKVVIVRLISGKNNTRGKVIPRFASSFTISLLMEPALTKQDAQDVDLIIEAIAAKLHGWWPESMPFNGMIWMEAEKITVSKSTTPHANQPISLLTHSHP